jgi:hypothetical protein
MEKPAESTVSSSQSDNLGRAKTLFDCLDFSGKHVYQTTSRIGFRARAFVLF